MLLLLGTMWGLGFSLAKIATTGGIAPITYSFWQSLGAGVVLSALVVLRGVRVPMSRRHAAFYLAMGITGQTIPNVTIILCVSHLPVGVAAVVVPLAPMFTCAIAYAIGLEGISSARIAGLVLGLAGTALVALPQAAVPEADQSFWVLIAMLTPLFYAIANIVAARWRPSDVDSATLAAAVHVVNATALLPIVMLGGFFYPLWPPFEGHELAVLAQMVVAVVGTILFLEVVRLAGPVFLSQAAYVVTTTAVLWGMLLFGERHGPALWVAIAAIFAGVLLVQRTVPARGPAPSGSRG